MRTNALPADEQTSEAVVPGVRSLDDPTSSLAPHDTDERLLAASSNVRADAAEADRWSDVRVVVALVDAQVLGTTRAARATQRHRIEDLIDHRGVGHVRAGDQRTDRHAAAVGENVPFYPAFRAIGRVRSREVPPFGAFTEAVSSELHFHAMPRRPS